MEFLVVLLIGLLFLLFFNYLFSQRDVMSPAVVMATMFVISTTFALINARNWNIDYSPLSVFYILSGILVFSIPVIIFSKKFEPINEIVVRRKLSIATWKILFAITLDLFIIYLYRKEMIQLAAQAGYTGESLQWFIRNMTNYEASAEFSGRVRLLVRFVDITAYIFMFTFLNNFVYKKIKLRDFLLLIPIFLFIYKTSLTGGRQDILRLLVAGVVQLYVIQKVSVGWKRVISTKYIFIGILGLILGIPSFYYGLFLVGRTTTRTLMESVSTYIGGAIQHFNQFVQEPLGSSRYFGEETLTPILNILGDVGIIDFRETVHLEFRQLGVTIGNVYTFFRRPLHDFGPIGMYLFVFLIGVFFSYFYYIVIRRNSRSFKWDINVIIYSYLFYWIFLSSIEQFSMTILSLFTLIAIVLFYLLSVFYWQFTFTPTGFALINRDRDIEKKS